MFVAMGCVRDGERSLGGAVIIHSLGGPFEIVSPFEHDEFSLELVGVFTLADDGGLFTITDVIGFNLGFLVELARRIDGDLAEAGRGGIEGVRTGVGVV